MVQKAPVPTGGKAAVVAATSSIVMASCSRKISFIGVATMKNRYRLRRRETIRKPRSCRSRRSLRQDDMRRIHVARVSGALLSCPVWFSLLRECQRALHCVFRFEQLRLQIVVLRERFLDWRAEAVHRRFFGRLH